MRADAAMLRVIDKARYDDAAAARRRDITREDIDDARTRCLQRHA